MKSILSVALSALVLVKVLASAATFYAVDRNSGKVWSVDSSSGEGKVVASGLGAMVGVTVDRRGRLFVSQFRGFETESGTVAHVDPISGRFSRIEGTAEVFGLAADPDADVLYVGGWNTGLLYRLEETSPDVWNVVEEVDFGYPNRASHALKDGNSLYVACQDSGIWVKDLLTGTLTFGVEISTLATTMAREMGGHLIVGSEFGMVYRIDPATWEVVQTYTGFNGPCGVAVDPNDNSVYVADQFMGSVSRVNLTTGEIVTVTTLPMEPWQIAFSPQTAHVPSFRQCTLLEGSIRLTWEARPGFTLEQTSTLSNPNWEAVSGTEGHVTMELKLNLPRAGSISDILYKFGINQETIGDLVTGDYSRKRYLQQIVHSEIDADQLDYLKRDSHFTGNELGKIDLDYIIETMEIKDGRICFRWPGHISLESMFQARRAMYESTYIHRVPRIAEAMLFRAVKLSLQDLPDLTSYTDDELFTRLMIQAGNPKSKELAERIKYRHLYKEVYKIDSKEATKKQKSLVKRMSRKKPYQIERDLLRKTKLEEGDVIVDFPADVVSKHRLTRTNIPILRKDGSIADLADVSPVVRAIVQSKTADALFSVYCAEENRDKVRASVEKYLLQHK